MAGELMQFLTGRQAAPLQSASTNATEAGADTGVAAQADQLTRLTREALANVPAALQNAAPAATTLQGDLSWFDRNQRKDEQGRTIPIDTVNSIPLGDFARVVWQRRPEERVAALRQLFPNSIVRRADTGEPLIEINDPGGTKRDVLLTPPSGVGRDLLDIAESSAGATAGGVAGMEVGGAAGAALGARLGPRGAAVGGRVGKIVGAALGTGIGGMYQDMTARSAEGIPLNFDEIKREQGKQVLLNGLWDTGFTMGAKALRVLSPFASERGPLQFNLQEGKEYLKREHGIVFETTTAEETGNPLLGRLERTEAQLPGSSTVLGGVYKRGQASLSDMLNAALGGKQTEEALGRDLMATARRSLVEPAEQAVQRARDALVRKGESELVGLIDSVAPSPVTKKEAGEALRGAFQKERDAAKAVTDLAYDTLRKLPGGSEKLLPGKAIADAAVEIEKELPTILRAKEVPGVDTYGNPIARTKVTKETLKSGRPEGLLTFLEDMKAQRKQKMTIDELTTLKNMARDEIAKTEAVPGVKDRWFGKVTSAYKAAIEEGVDALPESSIKDALTNAKETYMTRLLPFDREGMHDVLRTAYESGFQSPEQLVDRMFSGARADHNYRVMQETLGSSSTAFQQLRRSVFDGWMEKATDQLTGRINPGTLEGTMNALRDAHPEIYKDVMQGKGQAFFKATGALRAAGKEISDIDPNELRALMTSGSPTASSIQALMDVQRDRDARLANGYLRDLAAGRKTTTTPAQFVSSLFNADIDSKQLHEVIGTFSPAQQESLQKAALSRILTKASENKIDMARFLQGEQSPVQANALAKVLGAPGSAERIRNETLLGPDYVNMTRAVMQVLAPREEKTGLFKAAGSMAATGMLEKLLSLPLQYASKYAQKGILAELYLSAPVKAAIGNTALGPKETALLANALIASEPIIQSLRDTYGSNVAYSMIRDAKASIDRFVQQDTQPSQGEAQRGELMRFLQTGKGKVKPGVRP